MAIARRNNLPCLFPHFIKIPKTLDGLYLQIQLTTD